MSSAGVQRQLNKKNDKARHVYRAHREGQIDALYQIVLMLENYKSSDLLSVDYIRQEIDKLIADRNER